MARFNPLENNFCIYYVKSGTRRLINTAQVSFSKDTRHTMKIVQRGNRYACYLDGQKYLSGQGSHIPWKGGVGIWTKSDAVTSFDDFRIIPGK